MQTIERPEPKVQLDKKSERYKDAEKGMKEQRALIAKINQDAGGNIELFDLEGWQNAYESLLTHEKVIINETYKDHQSLDYKKALLEHYSRAMNAYISNQEDDPHVNKQRNRQPGIIERIGEVYFSNPDRSLDDLEKKLHDASSRHVAHKGSFLKTLSEIKKIELDSLKSELGDIKNASPTEQLDFFQKSIESLEAEQESLKYLQKLGESHAKEITVKSDEIRKIRDKIIKIKKDLAQSQADSEGISADLDQSRNN